ncbi:MAG: hypothetical protein QOH93_2607 [Chloroflexia bacterium]|jgi:hypothetical protein|nr:hypothetical protein [Chloroflexia bacterium]
MNKVLKRETRNVMRYGEESSVNVTLLVVWGQ